MLFLLLIILLLRHDRDDEMRHRHIDQYSERFFTTILFVLAAIVGVIVPWIAG